MFKRFATRSGVLMGLVVATLLLAACPNPVGAGKPAPVGPIGNGDVRTFYSVDISGNTESWYMVTADRLKIGTYCVIYQEQGGTVNAAQAASIADEFDTSIYTLIRSNFANEPDVDVDGKLIILLQDIKDGYNGSGGYIAGFFDGRHEFDLASYAYSNQCDMLTMDTVQATPGSTEFYQTMAHEFQHMVNFWNTRETNKSAYQDTWINEGLSSAAEALYIDGQVQWKIDYFNNDLSSGSGTIARGQNFLSWCPAWSDDPLASYATVYLFFQWLTLNAANGKDIYKEILASPYGDYRAVLGSANNRLYGGSSKVWKELYRDWLVANVLNEPTGLRGYKGEITSLSPPRLTSLAGYASQGSGKKFSMWAGEALYLSISSPWYASPGSGHMEFAGINTTSLVVDSDLSGGYAGNTAIAFQPDTTANTEASIAALPAYAELPFALSRSLAGVAAVTGGRTSFPIDYHADLNQAGGRYGSRAMPMAPSSASSDASQKKMW